MFQEIWNEFRGVKNTVIFDEPEPEKMKYKQQGLYSFS